MWPVFPNVDQLTIKADHYGFRQVAASSGSEDAASLYAQHGRHLYGESPEWGLASAYH